MREEQIFDSYTGHIQMVFRHSSLAEHWCLCDELNKNDPRPSETLRWKEGHGINLIFNTPFLIGCRTVTCLNGDAWFMVCPTASSYGPMFFESWEDSNASSLYPSNFQSACITRCSTRND